MSFYETRSAQAPEVVHTSFSLSASLREVRILLHDCGYSHFSAALLLAQCLAALLKIPFTSLQLCCGFSPRAQRFLIYNEKTNEKDLYHAFKLIWACHIELNCAICRAAYCICSKDTP